MKENERLGIEVSHKRIHPATKKKAHDFSITAFRVVQEATGQLPPEPQPTKTKTFDAKALGHLGGLKGGRVRAATLTSKRRTEIARKAALARWGSTKS